MSWLLPEPSLLPDERLLWRKPASLSLRTAVGGALHITTERVVFIPNRLNWGKMRQTHEWPINQIEVVRVADRDFTPYTGGMRKRMCLIMESGEPLLFVVKNLDETVREVQNAIAAER
jgi:hypothetical protein